jgi:hypothetical protein
MCLSSCSGITVRYLIKNFNLVRNKTEKEGSDRRLRKCTNYNQHNLYSTKECHGFPNEAEWVGGGMKHTRES